MVQFRCKVMGGFGDGGMRRGGTGGVRSWSGVTFLAVVLLLVGLCWAVEDVPVAKKESKSGGGAQTEAVKEKEDGSKLTSGEQKGQKEADKVTSTAELTTTEPPSNSTEGGGFTLISGVEPGAWLRGFYVLVGLSVVVLFYFVVKSVSLRRKRSKARRYGLLSSKNNVEMTPLGAEDDEDELFDATSHTTR